jgi:biopolymer transport protein ExbD
MLDMTFQLLAFFVLTFHPQSAVEGKVEFGLPADPQARNTVPEPPAVPAEPDPAPDEETRLTVVVRSLRDGVSDGNISALLVQSPEGEMAVRDLDELRRSLQQRRGDSNKGQVRIAAEGRLKYGCLMDVMDTCIQSGFANVGFTTPPDWGLN